MGRKVNPKIFRIGIIYQANSKWFAQKYYSVLLREDVQIRDFLRKKLKEGGVAKIEIERSAGKLTVIIYTSRPGVIIGRGGGGIEELKKQLKQKYLGSKKVDLNINIQEVDRPDLNAELILQGLIAQIEKRIPFRRVMKRGIEQVIQAGAQGVKIIMAGRLNGVEIARTETLSQGKVPLHTLRADIDYSRGTARTTYGAVGIKVWVYRGQIFQKQKKQTKII
ncbi:MAG: 30S ribosomal protein S3 [Candidatus Kerfeldbacteria bacterium CG_4_10_14_0_8_um_filter_42_10]|uniref:Small ribosomal subunit protein uS3 n=1 Tax=Candidatus Kerfeldbacteria bacterium CG_4_10_14_0_8_um_filter_42_10 TaxID=2014248 RepID=A0A2M7RI27_9BACT|nr:MAG: 30S ribosomal protein S3 [Candidatus Kerfeldbacteria bacterium CG_4_10_14_0_8_um_filter_42_10]